MTLIFFVPTVNAQSTPTISAEDVNVSGAGIVFQMDINISGADNIGGYDYKVTFDPTLLQYQSFDHNSDFPSSSNVFTDGSEIDNGILYVGVYSINGSGNGSARIDTITFSTRADDVSTEVQISEANVNSADPNITEKIIANTENGLVTVGDGGPVVTPSVTITETPVTPSVTITETPVTPSVTITQPPYEGPEGLMAHWSFNGSGSTAVDQTGNGHDGVISGATRVSSPEGKALRFNGLDHFVRVPDSDLFDISNKDVTIAVWFNADQNQPYEWPRVMDHFIGGDNGSGWWIGLDKAGEVGMFETRDSNNDYRGLRVEDSLNDGNWHHLAITKEGSILKIYLDGEQITGRENAVNLRDRDQDLFIGRSNNLRYGFAGDIDDVRYYVGALTATEVRDLYNNGGSTGGGNPDADGNSDGTVDLLDYVIWYNNYGTTTGNGKASGDYNNDGNVNVGDYVVWFEQYEL